MFDFALGVVIGAAFSPFWMKLWNFAKDKWAEHTEKK